MLLPRHHSGHAEDVQIVRSRHPHKELWNEEEPHKLLAE